MLRERLIDDRYAMRVCVVVHPSASASFYRTGFASTDLFLQVDGILPLHPKVHENKAPDMRQILTTQNRRSNLETLVKSE